LSDDEETYSTIFTALRHPIRRRILRMLAKERMSFTEMLNRLGIESPHLTYHLESLGILLAKTENG
jgi:DNA-binding transcriptional ArsR family regulator